MIFRKACKVKMFKILENIKNVSGIFHSIFNLFILKITVYKSLYREYTSQPRWDAPVYRSICACAFCAVFSVSVGDEFPLEHFILFLQNFINVLNYNLLI